MRDENAAEQLLSLAKQLVQELEAGNDQQVTNIIDELAKTREAELFQEIGKLTRELHSAITNLEVDSQLSNLAQTEIPDAKERLNYVITMTNQAANRTLNAVEDALPICEKLRDGSVQLNSEWKRFTNRQMSAEEFREVSKTLQNYLDDSDALLVHVKDSLNEVLMAQEFQDLTGQIINRVIKMVEDVEAHLVNLIKVAGVPTASAEQKKEDDEKGKLEGPQVPSLRSSDTVSGQDEVDDLLSSLGF